MTGTAMALDEVFGALQTIMAQDPVLVLGSGASYATGLRFGAKFPLMSDLAQCLRAHVPTKIVGDAAALSEWGRCDTLLDAKGLEGALNEVQVQSDVLLSAIVEIVADAFESPNREMHRFVLDADADKLPILRLVKWLTESTGPGGTVHAVTPNYDHVVECVCDRLRMPCHNGFWGFGLRCWDDVGARGGPEARSSTKRVMLYKPHGSLSWYAVNSGVVELLRPPDGLRRVMVVPGGRKYEQCLTCRELDQHRQEGNRAIDNAKAVLFYGYGFNDPHLQTSAVRRISGQSKPAIILARDLTDSAHEFVRDNPHVWAFERASDVATTCHHSGSQIELPGQLWDLDGYLSDVLGR